MPDVKRPSLNWYPGDNRRDAAVQACSIGARGLWREMMDLMHDGEPYGHLTAGGVTITTEQLALMVGVPLPLTRKLLKELEDRKVFSRTPRGVIYSRRMVKDDATRRAKKAAGKLGGNPALLAGKQEDNHTDIHPLKSTVNERDKEVVNHGDKQPPAKAVAVAVASPSVHPAAVDEFIAALPSGQKADHWRAIIEGWQQGLGFEGGKAATPEDVATGLTEYLATEKRDFAVIHVRSFVERAYRNRLKSAVRSNGKSASDADRVWKLLKDRGIHHITTAPELDRAVNALVTEGAILNAKEFKTMLSKFDLKTLRRAEQDSFAVRHISERINGSLSKVLA